jgi:acetyltransferase
VLREVGPLISPRSIAVIGASERNAPIVENAFAGGVPAYAVNPRRKEVLGRPCFPSISELPEVPETAVIAVGHSALLERAGEAIEQGVRALVVPGAGAEAGEQAPLIGEQIAELAEATGAAVLGTNCMGIARPDGPSMWISPLPPSFRHGSVSVIAQSGSVAEGLVSLGGRVGFRAIVSSGSEVARDAADFVSAFAAEEETRAIGLFLESVRRPDALSLALTACAEAAKPVACLKVGRSDSAARIALAHTGALVGSSRACSAYLAAHGVIEVEDLPQLVETLELLGRKGRPAGRRLAAVSESGGEAELLADQAEASGLLVDPLPEDVAATLEKEFPNFVHATNPLDAWAVDRPESVYPRSLELLANSQAFDIVAAQVDLTQYRSLADHAWNMDIVRGLIDATRATDVFPVVLSSQVNDPPEEIAAFARQHDLALLRGAGAGLRALAAVATWRPRRPGRRPEPSGAEVAGLLEVGTMAEFDSAEVLRRYGVAFPEMRRASGAIEAAEAAAEIGFPVVVKVDGPAHKSALGGVVLSLYSDEEVANAATALGGKVIVAAQLAAGLEVICGMQRDNSFGPVIIAGLGGALAEAAGQVSAALAPLEDEDAAALVAAVPGLAGAVTCEARQQLERILLALSSLACEQAAIEAVDLNPVIVNGATAVAADALVVVGEDTAVADRR